MHRCFNSLERHCNSPRIEDETVTAEVMIDCMVPAECHIVPATIHIDDSMSHTEAATAHMKDAADHIEDVTAHIAPENQP